LDLLPSSKFLDFCPFLYILFNFLKLKIDLESIYFESKEVPMEKVVHFFKTFTTIFHFKKIELGKILFGVVKV
jgi:hypothetical protein